MRLNECTKQELLGIIKVLKGHLLNLGEYYVKDCLEQIQRERELAKERAADAALDEAIRFHQEYEKILSKYAGHRISDIPQNELFAARDVLQKAQAASDKWRKLRGFPKKQEESQG